MELEADWLIILDDIRRKSPGSLPGHEIFELFVVFSSRFYILFGNRTKGKFTIFTEVVKDWSHCRHNPMLTVITVKVIKLTPLETHFVFCKKKR